MKKFILFGVMFLSSGLVYAREVVINCDGGDVTIQRKNVMRDRYEYTMVTQGRMLQDLLNSEKKAVVQEDLAADGTLVVAMGKSDRNNVPQSGLMSGSRKIQIEGTGNHSQLVVYKTHFISADKLAEQSMQCVGM